MDFTEWPLVFFTVFGQMAVGAFFVLGLIRFLGITRHSGEVVDRMLHPAVYAAGGALGLGFLASFFHLGNPANALNALRHVGGSWMSNEIVAGSLFAISGLAFAFLQWRRLGPSLLRQALALLTAILGVVLVYCMARLYMLKSVPAWNSWTTPTQFYLTAALLGSLLVAVGLSASPLLDSNAALRRLLHPGDADAVEVAAETTLVQTVLQRLGVAIVLLLPLHIFVTTWASLAPAGGEAEHPFPMGAFITRIVLLLLGAGAIATFLVGQARAKAQPRKLLALSTVALLLVLVAEIMGRLIFYGLKNRIGI